MIILTMDLSMQWSEKDSNCIRLHSFCCAKGEHKTTGDCEKNGEKGWKSCSQGAEFLARGQKTARGNLIQKVRLEKKFPAKFPTKCQS
jgi:hypothetical protein